MDALRSIDQFPYEVQERAAIYVFDAGMTEAEADARAIREFMAGLEKRKAAMQEQMALL